MFCPQCGKDVLDGDSFCGACGAAIDAVQTPGIENAANPFAVGSQTSNASGAFDGDAPIIPSNFFSAWKMVFSKYFDGKGRASRTEFWYWQIFLFILLGIPGIYFIYFVGTHFEIIDDLMLYEGVEAIRNSAGGQFLRFLQSNPPLANIFAWIIFGTFFLFCPNINLLVRRVHDFNKTGWLVLLFFIPKVGLLIPFIFGFVPGTKGANKYGPKPMKR